MGWVVNAMLRPFYARHKDQEHILQEAGWPPRAGLELGCNVVIKYRVIEMEVTSPLFCFLFLSLAC
jgi:hypothetical protein